VAGWVLAGAWIAFSLVVVAALLLVLYGAATLVHQLSGPVGTATDVRCVTVTTRDDGSDEVCGATYTSPDRSTVLPGIEVDDTRDYPNHAYPAWLDTDTGLLVIINVREKVSAVAAIAGGITFAAAMAVPLRRAIRYARTPVGQAIVRRHYRFGDPLWWVTIVFAVIGLVALIVSLTAPL
jgi:hypothetical protein